MGTAARAAEASTQEEEEDPDAVLFAALDPGLRRFAAVVGPDEVEPDDLVQEAVTRALRRGPLGSLDDPRAYLARTIVNLATNERRRLSIHRRHAAMAEEPAEMVAYPSDVDALLALPPRDRAVIFLVDVEGCPFSEVAGLLGCSQVAARARASRARRRLRRMIEDGDDGVA